MSVITLAEAQARLPELIATLLPGEELEINQGGVAVAKLVRCQSASQQPRQPGSAKDLPHWMAPDFDAPLEDFREYV